MPRIVVRCDASPRIGWGHLVRCRALAHALRSAGADVAFASRLEPRSLEYTLGFELVADVAGADVLVVDHYDVDADELARLRESVGRLAVIDDRADRDLTAADWILNQNLAAAALDYRVRDDCELLLGIRYALLRPEFAAARAGLDRRYATSDRRLLVTFGGGDTTRFVLSALDGLDTVAEPLAVRILVAAATDELRARAARSAHEVTIGESVEDMADEVTRADLSLNAGGTTVWELMCLGVPMIVTGLSPDQRLNPGPLADAGVAVAIPSAALSSCGDLVTKLLGDPARRAEMSARALELVDGRGAERAAASLMKEAARAVR